MSSDSCQQCVISSNPHEDSQNLVLTREDNFVVCLEAKPFSAGQIAIFPPSHATELESLSYQAKSEIFSFVGRCLDALEKICAPQGFNVGFNESHDENEHFTVQIIPRWQGDANFLATIGKVKAIGSNLTFMAEKLREALK